MSESLAKLAQKIDFSKTGYEELKRETEAIDNGAEEENASKDNFQSSIWPWDSVRNKLRYVYLNLGFAYST